MSHVQICFCSLLHQLCNEIITVWSLSLMMVFIGSGSGKGWLDGKPLPDEDYYPWFHIWQKSKMSWKGLIGVQILSYVLFVNEIVAVRHMCCSWSTTQKVECNDVIPLGLDVIAHCTGPFIHQIWKYLIYTSMFSCFLLMIIVLYAHANTEYDFVVKHNVSMKHWWDLSIL